MNKLLHLIFVVAAITCVYGGYRSEQKPPEFADQEGCYLSKFNAVLPVKQPYRPDPMECEIYTCQKNDGDTLVDTCGGAGVPPSCRFVQDVTADYPECCGRVVCDDD